MSLFVFQNDSATKAKKTNSPVYISPLIQHDTDEESDSTQTDGLNTSFSNRYSKNLSISISPQRPINTRATSSIYNGHEALHSDLISKSRYSNDGSLENGSYSNSNSMNASSESSTNGDHEIDDFTSPLASVNFTKRLLSFRNRNLGSNINAPLLPDRSKSSLKTIFVLFFHCVYLLCCRYSI